MDPLQAFNGQHDPPSDGSLHDSQTPSDNPGHAHVIGESAVGPQSVARTTGSLSNGSQATVTAAAGSDVNIANERLQLIDEDQKFNQQVGSYLVRWHLADVGFSYNLCAVVGSQSTGKSTLLNKLFGTRFDVMSESERRQTTKGIWMSHAEYAPILILDVEGSDGRERGEDQDFERKSALFSMASAEVLMVNMWEHQVGLYQGANMGMLKTVFEVNLGLFQAAKRKSNHASHDKTLVFFVIRDHIAVTPLDNLSKTLMQDINRIWDSLSKPEGLESSSISDFFDFEFTSLPHKLLQPEEFDHQVARLRSRFNERDDPHFLFKSKYHKRIPADGLPHYLESIWEQVLTNKDLDLPTQQEMLAQFRCDEIANAAFTQFSAAIKAFRKPVESGSVLGTLGTDMGQNRGIALAKFDKEASRYHADVYKRKRFELLEKLNTTLLPLFLGQLKNLHKTILLAFKNTVIQRLRGDGYDFGQVVSEERQKAVAEFNAGAALIILQETDWSAHEEVFQFEEDVDKIAAQCRADETVKMVTQIERSFKKAIAEPTEVSLSQPGPEMWDRALDGFRSCLAKVEQTYLAKAKSFNCTDEENAASLGALRRKSWLAFRAKVDEQTAEPVLLSKLRSLFEERFRYDDEGIPRVWKPDDDIDGFFSKARSQTLELIPAYAKIETADAEKSVKLPSTSEDPAHSALVDRGEEEEFDFADTLTVFGDSRRHELEARFRKEADAYYVEAKRSMVSSIAQVPMWIYAVMAALGWNEFIAIIRSPIYFTLLIMGLAGLYVVWRLNLSGPILTVSKTVAREVHRLADEQLRAHFSQPLPQPAILADNRTSTATSSVPSSSTSTKPETIELRERTARKDI